MFIIKNTSFQNSDTIFSITNFIIYKKKRELDVKNILTSSSLCYLEDFIFYYSTFNTSLNADLKVSFGNAPIAI